VCVALSFLSALPSPCCTLLCASLSFPTRRSSDLAQLEPCLASILGGKGEIFIFYKRESAERFGRIGEQRKNFLVCCPDDCRSWGGTPLKPEARRLDSACHHRGHGLQRRHFPHGNGQLKSPGAAKPLRKPLHLLGQMRSRQFRTPVFAFSGEIEAVIRSVVVGICSQ